MSPFQNEEEQQNRGRIIDIAQPDPKTGKTERNLVSAEPFVIDKKNENREAKPKKKCQHLASGIGKFFIAESGAVDNDESEQDQDKGGRQQDPAYLGIPPAIHGTKRS